MMVKTVYETRCRTFIYRSSYRQFAEKQRAGGSILNKKNNQKEIDNLITHKMQIIHIDEDQLELLVKLLTSNEENGEVVNKIYEILQNFIAVSKSTSQATANIGVLDMSKSLL